MVLLLDVSYPVVMSYIAIANGLFHSHVQSFPEGNCPFNIFYPLVNQHCYAKKNPNGDINYQHDMFNSKLSLITRGYIPLCFIYIPLSHDIPFTFHVYSIMIIHWNITKG